MRKLLVKPSNSVERRDIEFQKQLEKRARETEQHEEEMERVQNNIEIMNDKKRRLDHEVSELFFINEGLRKNLSERDVKMIFKANLRYFKQI